MTTNTKIAIGLGVIAAGAVAWAYTRKPKTRVVYESVEVVDSPYSEADGVCWSFANGTADIVDMSYCRGTIASAPGAGVVATASEYWERAKAALKL